jgi:hypothetical protein
LKVNYINYIHYVLKHKWFVFWACYRNGLIWRGLLHDMSKLTPREFIPYARMFYSDMKPLRDKTGYCDPYKADNLPFELAWLNHLHLNKHHWQYWALVKKDGRCKLYEMPLVYIKEMLCDWSGAGRAQKNTLTPSQWYYLHEKDIRVHPNTKRMIKILLKEMKL